MLIFMEAEVERALRAQYPILGMLTDEEVQRFRTTLVTLPQRLELVRIANLADLMALRETILTGMPVLGHFPSGYDLSWQGCCESLFIEEQYGPCCIWARATAEMWLQDMCLQNSDTCILFEKYRRMHKGENPPLLKCASYLGKKLLEEDHRGCKVLAEHGDWQVHHRLDSISGGLSYEDVLRKIGVSEKNLKKPGFRRSERAIMMGYRFQKGREMALLSMKELYGFLARRSNWQSPE